MQKAQIETEDVVCIACQESINNPICSECLTKGIKNWLFSLKPLNKKSEVECVICGKKIDICADCYIQETDNLVGDKIPDLRDDFRETFGLKEDARI